MQSSVNISSRADSFLPFPSAATEESFAVVSLSLLGEFAESRAATVWGLIDPDLPLSMLQRDL